MSGADAASSPYRALIDDIWANNAGAAGELDHTMSHGVRFFLKRELPWTNDVEDEVENVLSQVVTSIRRGELRDPVRLPAFVLAVVRQRVAVRTEAAGELHGGPLTPVALTPAARKLTGLTASHFFGVGRLSHIRKKAS